MASLKLKLRKKSDETEAQDSAAEAAQEAVDPGTPQIPGASYNMMTIRYVVEQRRSLVALVIAGAAAAALILMVGSWLNTRGTISDIQGEKLVLEQEMASLSEQITAMADTGGMTPERVFSIRDERLRAFAGAIASEVDYQAIIEKLSAFNNSRAWIEGYSFSAQGDQVVVSASGRATAADAVADFYNEVRNGLAGEVTVAETWPPAGFTGTPDAPAQFPVTVTFTVPMKTDRVSPLGIDPEVVAPFLPAPAQPAESDDVSEGADEEGGGE